MIIAVPVVLGVLVVLFATYLILGTVVRYRGGIRTCPQMLPHYQFWSGAARRVADGVLYVVTCGKHVPKRERGPTLPDDAEFGTVADDGDNMPLNDGVSDDDDDMLNLPAVV